VGRRVLAVFRCRLLTGLVCVLIPLLCCLPVVRPSSSSDVLAAARQWAMLCGRDTSASVLGQTFGVATARRSCRVVAGKSTYYSRCPQCDTHDCEVQLWPIVASIFMCLVWRQLVCCDVVVTVGGVTLHRRHRRDVCWRRVTSRRRRGL
jgi:hypothetical protein